MKRPREYGIDALRIVSMWMVVILHVLGQGGIIKNVEWPSFRYALAWFMEAAAYGAVNCYGLISGYVGVNAKQRFSSILYLWLQVVFYSISIWLIMHLIWPEMIPLDGWTRGFFPVNYRYYWYYSAYFLISFLIPGLNKILQSSSKRELMLLIVPVTVLLSVNHSVFGKDVFLASRGYSALWLVVLYLMGGSIRLYGDTCKFYRWIRKHWVLVFLAGTVVACAPKVMLDKEKIQSIQNIKLSSDILLCYVSPAIIASSLALFSFFSQWKPNACTQKWIGIFAPATFGVYLIHVHTIVWSYILKNAFVSFVDLKAYVLPFAVLGVATAIFVVCLLIELLRIKLFDILKIRKGCQWLLGKVGLS